MQATFLHIFKAFFFLSFLSFTNYYSSNYRIIAEESGLLMNSAGVDSLKREFNCVWIKYASVSADIILTVIKRPVRWMSLF